jgi:hypothetical protein
MISPNKTSPLPAGVASLVLLGAAAMYQWWPASSCEALEQKMNKGYFLSWLPPQLILVTADKKTLMAQAQNKPAACEKMLKQLIELTPGNYVSK